MRVTGLLSWYDEKPSWLAACIASMAKLCQHVVAVDGAYLGFPGGLSQPASPPVQADTILRTAESLGMGCTVVVPSGPWQSEVVKRSRMFEVGGYLADWLLVLDADELLSHARPSVLEHLPEDVVETTMWERAYGGQYPIRRLFRALPEIRVYGAHYAVRAIKDGRAVQLSGDKDLVPAFPTDDFRIEHRGFEREPERTERKRQYDLNVRPHLEAVGA